MGWKDAPLIEESGGGGKAAWESAPIVSPPTMQSETSAPAGTPTISPDGKKVKKDPMGPWEVIGEPALQMASGLAGSAVGGFAGMGTILAGGMSGDIAQNGLDPTMNLANKRVQGIQQAMTYQPRTETGKAVSGAIAWPLEKGTEYSGEAGKWVGNQLAGPEGANIGQSVGEGGFQSAALLAGRPWRMGAAAPVTEAGLLNELASVTNKGFDKGIKPKGAVQSRTDLLRQQKLQTDAVSSIIKGKDALKFTDEFGEVITGKVPEGKYALDQLSQAIAQRKLEVISKANEKVTKAGEAGLSAPLDPIVLKLQEVVNNPVLQDNSPAVVNYAKRKMEKYVERGEYTPVQLQEAMAIANSSEKIARANPTKANVSTAQVDALVANNMRQIFNDLIEGHSGPGFAAERAEFGALKSIEGPTNTALKRFNQKSEGSTLNLYSVFSAEDLLHGIGQVAVGNTSGGLLSMAKGTGLASIAAKLKMDKNPNRAVAEMFKKSEEITGKLEKLISEKEATKVIADFEATPEGQKLLPAPERGFEMREPGDVYSPYSPELTKGVNQLALPPGERGFTMRNPEDVYSSFTPREVGTWEKLYKMAQDPAGRRMLIEKLGREEKYSGILKELLNVEPLEALPAPPAKGLLDYTPNTDMKQTQVWKIGEKGPYMDQTQQYQVQPSGFVQQVPPSGLKKQKVYNVGQRNALDR